MLLLPSVVSNHASQNGEYAQSAFDWLKTLEGILLRNRQYQASAISTLRDLLISVNHGYVPADIPVKDRLSRKKVLDIATSQALQRAENIVSSWIDESHKRISEAELIAQQVIAVARSRMLIPPADEGETNTGYLRRVRSNLSAYGDIENALVHLEGLVGHYEALILLDRSLSQMST